MNGLENCVVVFLFLLDDFLLGFLVVLIGAILIADPQADHLLELSIHLVHGLVLHKADIGLERVVIFLLLIRLIFIVFVYFDHQSSQVLLNIVKKLLVHQL